MDASLLSLVTALVPAAFAVTLFVATLRLDPRGWRGRSG
jgi:hypothetical protein